MVSKNYPSLYNICWESQSSNSGDTIPLSGGDIGLNVWVEDGELFFYMSRAGCRDENGALLKLGRIRIILDPDPFTEESTFSQELKLNQGYVQINADNTRISAVKIKVWVEVHRPVIHVDIESDNPLNASVIYENWRFQDTILPDGNAKNLTRGMCMINYDCYPGNVKFYKDVFEPKTSSLLFYHRVKQSENVFEFQVEQQLLTPVRNKLKDPLKNLTWGGCLTGDNLVNEGTTSGKYASTSYKGWKYVTEKASSKHSFRIYTHIDQTENVDEWKKGLHKLIEEEYSDEEAWEENKEWWQKFWQRSKIVIKNNEQGEKISRNYNLMRYMLACNLSGREPTMFNGGLFTFDPEYADKKFSGSAYTPDHRAWGAALTAQNQRLLYWPLLKTGDFDLMIPGFDFYRKGLKNATERVKHYWDHEGCCFTEQIAITALPGASMYGFFEGGSRSRSSDYEVGLQISEAVSMVYESQLEWSWMILQYYNFSGKDISRYLPFIERSVIFYDEHYQYRHQQLTGTPFDEEGKLVIYPANTLEAHPDCKNPASVITGLKKVLKGLLELPERYESEDKKQKWQEILKRLPELPLGKIDGCQIVKPAENYFHNNWVMPEMYPLYPYQEYGLGMDNLELMENTFLEGVPSEHSDDYRAWTQGLIHYARLGKTKKARELAIKKLENGPHRFPAFWPQDIDWVPDHNWGGCGMVGVQEMLMQTHNGKILLLPAWPEAWDVDFKLHAPQNTIIEASVRAGKVINLKVIPEERRKDVIINEEQKVN